MRNERRDLAWYYGEEIGGRLWRALARQLANRKTQLGVDEDTLALEDVQVWAELGAPEVFSVLDLALSAQDAALRVRARVDLTSASVPVQVEAVARTEDAKEMQKYAAYFCEKGLVRLSAGLVPELGEDALDALAERLLAAYYPEALEKPRRRGCARDGGADGALCALSADRAGRRDLRRNVFPGDGDAAL